MGLQQRPKCLKIYRSDTMNSHKPRAGLCKKLKLSAMWRRWSVIRLGRRWREGGRLEISSRSRYRRARDAWGLETGNALHQGSVRPLRPAMNSPGPFPMSLRRCGGIKDGLEVFMTHIDGLLERLWAPNFCLAFLNGSAEVERDIHRGFNPSPLCSSPIASIYFERLAAGLLALL
ncbi:hypothetical protein BU23DRAFT_600388 [Bimuria novae-zelandiae CBS 107.79]|uniref:Uncharacterized protein n=1 Tax=Bimuria novae-zelandiae CBS 107.79 TaxID=1447943 RepID=A0A6A5V4U9_9PLEO|nr:hypothetical protein BU23DRAFT_600388 [Bimuria novae-zelandiae CBS 107.79]